MQRRQLRQDTRWRQAGASYVEYAVITAVALVVILGAIQLFFGGVAGLFGRLTQRLSDLG